MPTESAKDKWTCPNHTHTGAIERPSLKRMVRWTREKRTKQNTIIDRLIRCLACCVYIWVSKTQRKGSHAAMEMSISFLHRRRWFNSVPVRHTKTDKTQMNYVPPDDEPFEAQTMDICIRVRNGKKEKDPIQSARRCRSAVTATINNSCIGQ